MKSLNWYQNEARRTAPRDIMAYPDELRIAVTKMKADGYHTRTLLKIHDVLIWSLGLAGEAGEVADLMKKVHGHGKAYDANKLLKELGDVLWYLSNIADAHGFTLEDVAQTNVDKLRARYPNGFTIASAEAKADEHAACPDCIDDVCSNCYMKQAEGKINVGGTSERP